LQAGADVSKLARNPAVALFLDRARAANPDFTLTAANVEAVATICCRLDGLPLAIELAPARVKLLAPDHWLRRLEHRLAVLTEGARGLPARQQTWRATLDWSYDLLNEAERCLLARLSEFVGGCALEWSFGREAPPADAELGLRLAVALSGFWTRRDYPREGHEWFERALAADDA
jgi:predicted ATPase